MRSVFRTPLPTPAAAFLSEKQAQIDDMNVQIDTAWNTARKSPRFAPILQTLKSMAGERKRCMYCVDSEGSDVEHFKPKSKYPENAFIWPNMLLCCTPCGRLKGAQFPLDAQQSPLLINPSLENPWEYLDFDFETGNLDARYSLEEQNYSAKGEATVKVLQLNAREHLAKGYKISYLRLEKIVRTCIAETNVIQKLIEADDHGLLGWCFSPTGRRAAPFSMLTDMHRQTWLAHQTGTQNQNASQQ